jgi:hypothetical protein
MTYTQDDYERNYSTRMERDRPRPTHELGDLRQLADKAKTDPAAALDFAVACTPQTFLLALAAARWDDQHPFYSCHVCRDGADLPQGYECRVCGAEN